MGVTNLNERAKFAVALLEGKALTWWRGMIEPAGSAYRLDTIEWPELCTLLDNEFEDIDRELKLRRKIQNLR